MDIIKLTRRKFGLKIADLVIVAAGVALSVFFIGFSPFKKNKSKKLQLVVGGETYNLPWINGTMDLRDKYDKRMVIEINDGKARVIQSSCPDKLCVKSGWVSECGHIAACLPNNVALIISCSDGDYEISS